MPLFPPVASLALLATTTATGYTLANGTGTILSWTAPSDGNLHRVTLFAVKSVTTGETGGQITFGSLSGAGNGHLNPDNAANWATVFPGGQSAGGRSLNGVPELIIGAGNTVYLYQSSALSGGATTLWAEIWGS